MKLLSITTLAALTVKCIIATSVSLNKFNETADASDLAKSFKIVLLGLGIFRRKCLITYLKTSHPNLSSTLSRKLKQHTQT